MRPEQIVPGSPAWDSVMREFGGEDAFWNLVGRYEGTDAVVRAYDGLVQAIAQIDVDEIDEAGYPYVERDFNRLLTFRDRLLPEVVRRLRRLRQVYPARRARRESVEAALAEVRDIVSRKTFGSAPPASPSPPSRCGLFFTIDGESHQCELNANHDSDHSINGQPVVIDWPAMEEQPT